MSKIKLGLIGYGYWGPNFARLINESENCELTYCADLLDTSLTQVKNKYPHVTTTKNYHDILKDPEIQAVFVVTPTKTHYKIAKDAITAKKHVFVEKPFTHMIDEAKELIALAKKNNVKIMVGHVFLYNSSVKYIKHLIDKGELGNIRHLHFQRRNLGKVQADVNVLYDLAPHDISMLLYFIKQKPVSVLAVGQSYLQKNIEEVVSACVKFEDGVMANFIFSWIDPLKIRDITIVGDKKMLWFDDVNVSEKIKIFDKNVNIIKNTRDVGFGEYQIAMHAGDIYIPAIENKEPLKEEFNDFITCITTDKQPVASGENGLAVLQLLQALQTSLENQSQVITL
jgi:predicted dehydrogenase